MSNLKSIKRGIEKIIDLDLIDSNLSGTYQGVSLTSVTVEAILYNSPGAPVEWALSNDPVYSAGWTITISEEEANQSYSHGRMSIRADEIEPVEININFNSEGIIVRGEEKVELLEFIDSDLSGIYEGTSLTDVIIEAITFDSPGTPVLWTISKDLVYISGTSWSLTITDSESQQVKKYGSVSIRANEIEPIQLNYTFVGDTVVSTGNPWYYYAQQAG